MQFGLRMMFLVTFIVGALAAGVTAGGIGGLLLAALALCWILSFWFAFTSRPRFSNVGPGTIWRADQGVKPSEIKDGMTDTILLVEMGNSGIKWAEPRDLDLNNLPAGITKQNLLHALSNHAGGFNAVFADGHLEFILETISWEDFMAMLTIAGGETVDRSKW